MKAKLITNPYIIYSFGFIPILILYSLHWSSLYPGLSIQLLSFIVATAFFSLLIGILINKTNYLAYKNVSYKPRLLWFVTAIILISYFIEFAYMRVIPIVAILSGAPYDYTTFGIPTFHVILVTFNSFWSVFIFHNFISQKKKNLLLCYILSLIPSILIFSRGNLLLCLGSSFFVLFMSAKHVRKLIFKLCIFITAILFLFGIAGNIRLTRDQSITNVILDWGGATDNFRKSFVPNEFFWGYLYATSSLANLQETINDHDVSDFSWQKFAAFINHEFLPDFLSKRTVYFSHPYENINKISTAFTVGTVYGRSYAYMGWWGAILMFFYILGFNLIVILTLARSSIFFITGIAILDCIMLFNIFDNMFSFSGLSLQLFYPIVFGFFSNVKFNLNYNPSLRSSS